MAETKLSYLLINEIITQLKPLNPDKVILFGSYAWGVPDDESDIDLFIVKRSTQENVRTLSLEAIRCLRPLVFKYKKGFDVLLDDPERIQDRVERIQDQFYIEIHKNGVALYAK
jgi:predicted nucleotidyltransferase